jgi:hypothetical protein
VEGGRQEDRRARGEELREGASKERVSSSYLDIERDYGQVVADRVDVVGGEQVDGHAADGLGVVCVLGDELSVGEAPHADGAVASLWVGRVGWG